MLLILDVTCIVERVSSQETSLALPCQSTGSKLSRLRASARSWSNSFHHQKGILVESICQVLSWIFLLSQSDQLRLSFQQVCQVLIPLHLQLSVQVVHGPDVQLQLVHRSDEECNNLGDQLRSVALVVFDRNRSVLLQIGNSISELSFEESP